MAQSVFDPTMAQDKITDWLTEVSGHELWLKEQLTTTKQRYGSYENCLRQANRLKGLLESQSGEAPSQQQYELIEALKNDFGKAVSKIQDDLFSNQSGQSLEAMKQSIQQYMDANQELNNALEASKAETKQHKDELANLRDENERLERLRDLLMQQQDNFTQRLSEVECH